MSRSDSHRSWYSGSDARVRKMLDAFEAEREELDAETRIARLEEILALERDPCWRGYLLSRIGFSLVDGGRDGEAARWLERAQDAYRPLDPAMADVFPEYAATLYWLLIGWLEQGQNERVVQAGTTLLAHGSASGLDEFDQALVCAHVGSALHALGRGLEVPAIGRWAVPFFLGAHALQPDDQGYLERLALVSADAGREDLAQAALAALARSGAAEERRARIARRIAARFPGGEAKPS